MPNVTTQQHHGRFRSNSTLRRDLRRTFNGAESALAEKALAKALQGDSAALLACAQLLTLAMSLEGEKAK